MFAEGNLSVLAFYENELVGCRTGHVSTYKEQKEVCCILYAAYHLLERIIMTIDNIYKNLNIGSQEEPFDRAFGCKGNTGTRFERVDGSM